MWMDRLAWCKPVVSGLLPPAARKSFRRSHSPYGKIQSWRGPLRLLEVPVILVGAVLDVRATAFFVDGLGSRLAAGRTPLAEAGAPTASDSRSWCRWRRCRARCRRPPLGGWPSRRRAVPRTALVALRSAGPDLGRAKSPPAQVIEHSFGSQSATLPSPAEPLRSDRTALPADWPNPTDRDVTSEATVV